MVKEHAERNLEYDLTLKKKQQQSKQIKVAKQR